MAAGWLMGVVAQAPAPRAGLWDARLLWAGVALVAALVVGAVVIYLLDRWRRQPDVSTWDPNDELARFRQLYEAGELSQAEFDRIKARLTPHLAPQRPAEPERPSEPDG